VRFTETPVPGAFLIELEPVEDDRGFFARAFCQKEFEAHGLNPRVLQCNISFNRGKGTLRGLHYQAKPLEEARLVRCTRGSVYDVIADVRPASPAFMKWFGWELSCRDGRTLYVPEGVAHGFQTLEGETEVFYQMSESYAPSLARGVRWNDEAFRISWPLAPTVISERDRQFPDFRLRGE
jgi:dTDP-4-dehydrorhamnose 3,5-epimerase